MIDIGTIRNLALVGLSFAGETGERIIIYDLFDIDISTSFCIVESVEEVKPTDFLTTVALMNGKRITDDFADYESYLPMQFTVATAEHEIDTSDDMIVIANPKDIDSEKVEKCMDYLKCLKSRLRG